MPLGGWDRGASKVEWLDGSVQAGRPYGLGQHRGQGSQGCQQRKRDRRGMVEYIKSQTRPGPNDNFKVT